MKLLVAEDDRAVRTSLQRALTLEGYVVATVKNGAEALAWLATDTADALLLDVTMPVVDGLTVCRVLRGEGNRVPILMLTARAATGDRIAGLDAGADDYLPKPFDLGELLAQPFERCRAHDETLRATRRRRSCVSAICASTRPPAALAHDVELDLTKTEFDLLELLVRNAGIVLDHSTIYERIWNYDFGPDSKNLAVYIGYLRRKTEAGDRNADPHRARGGLRGPHRLHPGPTDRQTSPAGRPMSLRWKIAIAVGAMAALATLAVGYSATGSPRPDVRRDRRVADRSKSRRWSVTATSPTGTKAGPGRTFYQTQLLGPDGSVQRSTSPAGSPAIPPLGRR